MSQSQKNVEASRSKRWSCPLCQRPQGYCLCPYVKPLTSRACVLVLQHPSESRHPFNTGRLAALSLSSAQLLVGETFPELPALIKKAEKSYLLFPGEEAVEPPSPLPSACAPLVIVPDGTWRKASRIIHANPVLQSLPRWRLPAGQSTRYQIRRARRADAVATVEAVERVLTMLEPEKDFSALLTPFDAMVEQQIQVMGNVRRQDEMQLSNRDET